jgi:hypothetical protein
MCAVFQTSPPPLGAGRVQAADDALPAVEVCGAAESRQANLVIKAHGMHYEDCNLVVDGLGRCRYKALRYGTAMYRNCSVEHDFQSA